MFLKPENAAAALLGKTLKNKWKVTKRLEPKEFATGGFFSVTYIVEAEGKEAFLKAINFLAFFQMFAGKPIIEILNEQTSAFRYERDLLQRCKNNHLSKIATILDEGEEVVPEFTIQNVPYLIFEIADGDIRAYLNFNKDADIAWKLKSLHDVSVGLQQLHSVKIGHQDLKPSNVLTYSKGIISKLADLGRALCSDIVAPHDINGNFPGDLTYAPPEFLYRYIEPDLNLRMRATDMYLLGSLMVFYFIGTNMTALMGKNIDPQFRWDVWQGSFTEVQDYLVDGFYKAIKEFRSSLANSELAEELSVILEYTCHPYPEKRGYPKARTLYGNPYDLQRIISKFDILSKKAEYRFK